MVDVLVANELDAALLAAEAGKTFGVKLVGGGTLVPPMESDQWRIENDLANIPDRSGRNPNCATLRHVNGVYKIDLRAWGMNWLDNPDAAEARKRHRPTPITERPQFKALEEGRYRTIDEFRNVHVGGDKQFLQSTPDSPAGKPPRKFRRPVRLDLSTPLAAYRTILTATAEGDADALAKCTQIVDPSDEAPLRAWARFIGSFATLQEEACQKFGIAGTHVGVPAELPNPRIGALQQLTELDRLERQQGAGQAAEGDDNPIVITGDRAQWKEAGEVQHEFVRVSGQWKVCSRLAAEVGKHGEEGDNDWPKIFGMVSQLQEDFAKRIGSSEFASAEAAQAALQQAARAPSTEPAGGAAR